MLWSGAVALAFMVVAAGDGLCAPSAWDKVWKAVQEGGEPVPEAALDEGPPVQEGERVLFRYRPKFGTKKVHLGGSFNAWAENDNGRITNPKFAMQEAGDGLWFQWVELPPGEHAYQYVEESEEGGFEWLRDPHADDLNDEGQSLLVVAEPEEPAPDAAGAESVETAPRKLRVEKVWVRPGEPNALWIGEGKDAGEVLLEIKTPLGKVVHTSRHKPADRIPIPPLAAEGGYVATLTAKGGVLGEAVLSVAENIADDLRYGFYASFGSADGDHAAKAGMLADLHVNAVEFYDYFPGHGRYAPTERHYRLQPFGIEIDAEDVRGKIEAARERNILSIAYVAAYAASPEVYDEHPHPMTDEHGAPKIFNGKIMTEAEANEQGKPKWFWLMNVAAGSPWHEYILGEFRRTLDDGPGDMVSFDGFEIDVYGDDRDARFYAGGGSPRDGDLLRDVLRDFVGDVQKLTKSVKPHGVVSFNSVNEFGVAEMVDVTDFLFMEIWRYHSGDLGGLVDICFRHREPRRQRVVLKLYPADMEQRRSSWPDGTLARVLGAAMTGGGSLMVAGEPDEKSGVMHGLNTLYYPDHTPMLPGSAELLGRYYGHDAMMFGYTHGRNVFNTKVRAVFPGAITRVYAAPDRKALVVQILRTGKDRLWSSDVPLPPAVRDQMLTMSLPGGVKPEKVWFASPDSVRWRHPVPVEFEVKGEEIRVTVPELSVHGTLVMEY
ncbi:MAG: hypothetical protein IAE97_07755 [Chthoniobacterales bacterium]|nr:hypothetical protein [Chthoniobacterales bacterium]